MQKGIGFVIGFLVAVVGAWNIYEVRARDALLVRHENALREIVAHLNKQPAQSKEVKNEEDKSTGG